jgi:hypothetical protein
MTNLAVLHKLSNSLFEPFPSKCLLDPPVGDWNPRMTPNS